MSREHTIHGRIEEHGTATGTSNHDSVRARAREIAVTNGRRADDVNEADLAQAREELQGVQDEPVDSSHDTEEQSTLREPLVVSSGRMVRAQVPSDEQTLPEDLVHEGVEEATHDQMLEGNRNSRSRDEAFDDQLPEAEP